MPFKDLLDLAFLRHRDDELRGEKDYRYVRHTVKYAEIQRIHAKYRRWCAIHNITYHDYSDLKYDRKLRMWMMKR